MPQRRCKICSALKPTDSFSGKGSYCKPCQATYIKAWRKANAAEVKAKKAANWAGVTPRAKWDHHLRMRYGITVEDWEKLAEEQKHLCAICEQPEGRRRLSVDHCHKSGKVRRLLCDRCNTLLGRVKDDPKILQRAAAYLLEHQDG